MPVSELQADVHCHGVKYQASHAADEPVEQLVKQSISQA